MHEILTEITEGRGTIDHIDLLEELGWVTAEASLCQLGGTAPNPVLSTIRYFRDEYEEHIIQQTMSGKGLPGTSQISNPLRCLQDVRQMCQGLSGGGHHRQKENEERERRSFQDRY